MVRRPWTKEDTCALIAVYEKNPILWNSKCEGYRNKKMKNKVISEIAEQFSCYSGEIAQKLHSLRNRVSQELNKIKKKSGSGADEAYTSPWPYFSPLKFLLPELINTSTTSNVGNKEEDTHSGVNSEEIQETNNSGEKQIKRKIQWEKVKMMPAKRKCTSDDDNPKVLKRALETRQAEPNDNDRFGEYVAMELKTLQSELNRRRLKSEIRKAITRIADEDDNTYFSSLSAVPKPYTSPSATPIIYQQPPGTSAHNNAE